jgi:hypothetical protein
MISLPQWIVPVQYEALRRIVADLTTRRLPYVATGGLAGNLHGSTWPLQDIDLDVPREALDALASANAGHVRCGPAHYHDDEFDLELLTLEIEGVAIDLTASESIRLRAHGSDVWRAWPTNLYTAERRFLAGLEVRVQPLAQLVSYKRFIGRVADVADLEVLLTGANRSHAPGGRDPNR